MDRPSARQTVVRLLRGYRYRIYPTPAQEARLLAWEGALRWLWNVALEQRFHAYGRCRSDRRYPMAIEQQRELTDLRAILPWLEDVPRHACTEVLRRLDSAWRRCWCGLSDTPRWKRKQRDPVGVTESDPRKFSVEHRGRRAVIVFPKLGSVEVVAHRPLAGAPKRCTITRDGDQWFASVLCEIEAPDPAPSTKPAVALDRGVVNLIADSDGRVVENPRPLEKARKRLARAQRAADRKRKGSKNRKKANTKVARLHRKIRRQRAHVLHVESARYAKNHGTVIVEQLDVQRMTRSARGTTSEPGSNVRAKSGLNRAILDSGWGRFVEMLRYKVVLEGGCVIEVPAAYSSQTCAACGAVDPASRPTQARFACTSCGHTDHADVNAARVLLARGMKLIGDSRRADGDAACGGSPVTGPTKQERPAARRVTHARGREQLRLLGVG